MHWHVEAITPGLPTVGKLVGDARIIHYIYFEQICSTFNYGNSLGGYQSQNEADNDHTVKVINLNSNQEIFPSLQVHQNSNVNKF